MNPDLLYHEQYRPQFHFTAAQHWLNDPNGLVYYQGEYHLFFQHNPFGCEWGNISWGHAVSSDLLHWQQLPHALLLDDDGQIYSGSAVVDWQNTSGFQQGPEPVLAAAYTSAGEFTTPPRPFTQSLAYSQDRGRTWVKYAGNPVLPNLSGGGDRDPKLLWHAPTQRWVMVLYIDRPRAFAFFTSPDLKTWTETGTRLLDRYECPDLFALPVDGQPDDAKWVLLEASGAYVVGTFDGQNFQPETEKIPLDYGGNFYASQTYNDIPATDGRCIQMVWMRGGKYPGMPFNQQMGIPCVLSLRRFPEGIRLCRQPVQEIVALRTKHITLQDQVIKPGANPFRGIVGQLFEIRLDLELRTATRIILELYGQKVEYDAATQRLSACGTIVEIPLTENRLFLHLLVDRTSLELFVNYGRMSLSSCFLPPTATTALTFSTSSGDGLIRTANVYELRAVF